METHVVNIFRSTVYEINKKDEMSWWWTT